MSRCIKILFFIAIICTSRTYGQTFEKFQVFTTTQIDLYQEELKEYNQQFATLFKKRDTSYLREKLSDAKADKIYLIEGYNFKTGQYSLFEEYKVSINSSGKFITSEVFLDKKEQSYGNYYFLFDSTGIDSDQSYIDTIFPRKYRYGAGCIVTDEVMRIFRRLKKKAKKDGVVKETYCRVETIIDKRTNGISVKYCFPVYGKRECDLRAGMGTDYPESFDYWLFVSPYYAGN